MKLFLYRHTYNENNIIGDLFIDEGFFCHTLEDIKRPDGVKVKHETAIPPGEYKLILSISNKFKRLMPEILNVEGFSGIRMHGGNDESDTSGCPIVAFKTDYKRIWQTAEKNLTDKLKTAKDEITISIEDRFLSYDRENKKLKG